jgi:hypothetical protein
MRSQQIVEKVHRGFFNIDCESAPLNSQWDCAPEIKRQHQCLGRRPDLLKLSEKPPTRAITLSRRQ